VSAVTRGNRRKNPRCFAAQAKQGGTRGQYRVRIPLVFRPAASGTRPKRADRAGNDSGPTLRGSHSSRHRRYAE
jgi:hypothetical protein